MDTVFSAKGIVAYRRNVVVLKHKDVPDGWVLPGNKLMLGELPKVGLARDVKNELGLDAVIGDELATAEWSARIDGLWRRVSGIFFACTVESYAVTLGAEHSMSKWINPANYKDENVTQSSWPAFEKYLKK